MKRGVLTLICVALFLPALPVSADEVYPIVFPVAGKHSLHDNYGACRGGAGCPRLHEGVDIMADKMTPVVAAADGVVRKLRATPYTDGCGGGTTPSYSLYLEHDDGYESRYLHLNNDTPDTDDGQGKGFREDLAEGTRVRAGELIGWVGDSGNAECVGSHLHFELHSPDGHFDGYPSLLAANHVDPAASDEIFFYRNDGLFRYYDINSDATLGSPLASGDNYTRDWSTITAIDLDGDGVDEIFFYRNDGLFRYYDIRADGTIPKPMTAGDNYTKGWDSISAVDLDGDGQDEMFYYREDGLYRYYDVRSNGSIPKPLLAGDEYTRGWDAITAVDINGDGRDEMFFYRKDGLYRFYPVQPNGKIGKPISSGSDFAKDWSSITAVDLNGDGHDEMLFYREDGTFSFRPVSSGGVLGHPILSGDDYTTGWSSITALNLDG